MQAAADGDGAGDPRLVVVPIGISTVYAALVHSIAEMLAILPGTVNESAGASRTVLQSPARRGVEKTMTTTTMLTTLTMTTPTTWNEGEWRAHAACSNFDTNLFFPEPEAPDALAQIAKAKAVCAACPVRENCLEFAIRTRQLDGVWGGHTPEERRSIRRRRQAAARKAAA